MSYPKPSIQWATLETNYPAGPNPWSGQAVKVAPPGDILTPDTLLPAEWYNYVTNAQTQDVKNVRATIGEIAAFNWRMPMPSTAYPLPSVTFTQTLSMCWNPLPNLGGEWLLCALDSTTHVNVWYTLDNGFTWAAVGTYHATIGDSPQPSAGAITACKDNGSRGTLGNVIVGLSGDQASNAGKCVAVWNGTTWSYVSNWGALVSSTNAYVGALAFYNGIVVAFGFGNTFSVGNNTNVSMSSDRGVTWTQSTTAGFSFTDTWFTAQSATHIIGVPRQVVNGGTGAFVYLRSADGTNWTSITGTLSVSAGIIVGVSYDSANAMFVLVTNNGFIYSSSDDGATWQLVRTLGGSIYFPFSQGGQMNSLACVGSLWWLNLAGGALNAMAYSIDVGQTWTPVSQGIGGGNGGSGFAASDVGVVMCGGTAGFRFGLNC